MTLTVKSTAGAMMTCAPTLDPRTHFEWFFNTHIILYIGCLTTRSTLFTLCYLLNLSTFILHNFNLLIIGLMFCKSLNFPIYMRRKFNWDRRKSIKIKCRTLLLLWKINKIVSIIIDVLVFTIA